MRPVVVARRAFHPDRRWATLAKALACSLGLLVVCQYYQQQRQQQHLSGATAAATSLMLVPPQGPKHACVSDDWMVWEEYRECVEATAARGATFGDYLRKTYGSDAPDAAPPRPWAHPPASGILVEFRPLDRLIRFAVSNAMDNLPVAWCFYVAGNAGVRAIVQKHFAAEVAVRKVRLIDMDHDDMLQHKVSQILSAKSLYDQMEGDHWLFFQVDSAICRAQRHLLKGFMDKGYGWWGAPWASHIWGATPYTCGNGGFSLRARELMMPILEAAPGGTGGSEDGYFCGSATGSVQSGRTKAPPAPYYEELQFSVETMMHTKPFAVHAPWKDFMPSWEVRELVNNCPEILNIMPEPGCGKFATVLCAADVDRSLFVVNETTACNWGAMCSAPVADDFRAFHASLGYRVA